MNKAYKVDVPDYIKKHMHRNPINYSAGVHCKTFSGRPSDIDKAINAFYQNMKAYPNFRVINITSTPTPRGVYMYITFEV